MALYELRTYTLHVGKMAEAVKLYQYIGFPALQKGGQDKNLVGYFQSDTGPLTIQAPRGRGPDVRNVGSDQISLAARPTAGRRCGGRFSAGTALSKIAFSARPLTIGTADIDQPRRLLGDETDPRKCKCH
jgi:hypothetical protein